MVTAETAHVASLVSKQTTKVWIIHYKEIIDYELISIFYFLLSFSWENQRLSL